VQGCTPEKLKALIIVNVLMYGDNKQANFTTKLRLENTDYIFYRGQILKQAKMKITSS